MTSNIKKKVVKGLFITAAIIGSYIGGWDKGYNAGQYNGRQTCIDEEILFEKNIREGHYKNIKKINREEYLAQYDGFVGLLDRAGRTKIGPLYDEIKIIPNGYECIYHCEFSKGVVSIYADYLNQNFKVDSTRTLKAPF